MSVKGLTWNRARPRYFARTAARPVALAAHAIACVVGTALLIGFWMDHRPPPATQVAAMEEQWEQAQAQWAQDGADRLRGCEEAKVTGSLPPSYDCGAEEPQRSAYVRLNEASPKDAVRLFAWLSLVFCATAFGGMLLGTGMDFTSSNVDLDSVVNQVKGRYFRERLGATGAWATQHMALGVLVGSIGGARAWALARTQRHQFQWGPVAPAAARAAGIVFLAAILGFGVGMLARSALGGIAAIAIWTTLVELPPQAWAALVHLSPWTMLSNVFGFIYGRGSYTYTVCPPNAGYGCDLASRGFSLWHATAYLVGTTALLVGLAYVRHTRSDLVKRRT